MQGGALIAAIAILECLGATLPAQRADGQDYIAYRSETRATPEQRTELWIKARSAGLVPIQDTALERAGLWVFEIEDSAMANSSAALFRDMQRVPIKEYAGVLSVPTGSFYLSFVEGVSNATARRRVEALGFKVLTPTADSNSFLVVAGTRRPADQQRELSRLEKLEQLLYVAPHDIPLQVPVRKK